MDRSRTVLDKDRSADVSHTVHTKQDQGSKNELKEGVAASMCTDMDSYSSFLAMVEKLVRVIYNNKNLQCLQLKPLGRFPLKLLEALSKQDQLRILFLNGWHDFQEYSLQLIMEACPHISHLSLGDNDFTRFTLETVTGPIAPLHAPPKSEALSEDTSHPIIELECYDDPIKGRSGPFNANLDPMGVTSKRAVVYTSPSPLSSRDLLDDSSGHILTPQHLSSQYTPYPQPWNCDSAYIPRNQIRTLTLCQVGLHQEFLLNLTRMCPRLEHLSLLNGWGFYPSSRFASILSQTCPHLKRLEFREQSRDLQDEFFASLCTQIPGLEWIHASMTGFSQCALGAVRVHCKDIVSLNLDGARGVQSPALAEILTTCGSLKVLSAQGVVLNGRDLDKELTWACHGLETLVLDIEIYAASRAMERASGSLAVTTGAESSSIKGIRELVYKRLSDLTRLQMLGLGGGHCVGSEPGVDLTLVSGLAGLTTLHCLERLDVRRLTRSIGHEDIAWMVQHWPRFRRLEIVKRQICRSGDKTNKAISWLAQMRPGMDILH
ncbi:hypothetical protein BGX28_004761 [Mortierella sp. GBA30]|nr:hypothetical protein BGX28_004761 [Mortierella sp. GBA30]